MAAVCDECYKRVVLRNGTIVTFRPLAKSDLESMRRLFNSFSQETVYFRFLAPIRVMDEEAIERYLDVDYVHAVAIVATVAEEGKERFIGVARYYADEKNPERAEFAIAICDEWQRKGVGTELMKHLCDVARKRGVKLFYALAFKDNIGLFKLLNRIGVAWDKMKFDEDTVRVEFLL